MNRTRIATIAIALAGTVGAVAIFAAPEEAKACSAPVAAMSFVTAPV